MARKPRRGKGDAPIRRKGRQAEASPVQPAAPAPASVDVERLLAEARGAGELVEEGAFRLDLARAREKIKSFQLADPHQYVLELARAALAAGAPEVDIRQDADDLTLSFAGQPFAREELARLLDHLFSAEPRLAPLRHLALGVNTALALAPRRLRVECGDGERGLRLEVRGLDALELVELGAGEAPRGTRIQVRERWSWKVVREALFVRNPEEPLLEAGCRFAPVPVRLNGRDLRAPLVGEAAARCAFQAGPARGGLALPATPALGCRLWLCLSGVVAGQAELTGDPLAEAGAVGFVEHPGLKRNASHSGVIRDGAYQICLRAARGSLPGLLREWLAGGGAAAAPGWGPETRRAHQRRLQLAARLLLRPDSDPAGEPALARLLALPAALPSAVGDRLLSLGEAWEHRRRTGRCRVARRGFALDAEDLPPGWLVLRLEGEDAWPRATLEACLGPLLDADDELEARERVALCRRAREAERGPARLGEGAWLVRLPFAAQTPPLEGEIGLPARPLLGLSFPVVFRRGGVPLARREATPPALACAELESAAFRPTPGWDGVEEDEAYHGALARLEAAAPALLEALARRFPELPPPAAMVALPCWTERGLVAASAGLVRPDLGGRLEARLAREHTDRLLERWAPVPGEVPAWLSAWRLFHALDGRALSLDALRADPRPLLPWVGEQSWGGGPKEACLNLSGLERRLLEGWLGAGRLEPAQAALEASRAARARDAEVARRREENVAAAERCAQPARLRDGEVLVALELPPEAAPGQVGVAAAGRARGSLRCLLRGLPVCELAFPAPVPVLAVAELGGLEDVKANPVFDAVEGPGVERTLHQVRARLPALFEALIAREDAPLALRQRLLRLMAAPGAGLDGLPPAVRQARLLPSVAHGLLSLDELAARLAHPHGDGDEPPVLRFTPAAADRQRDPRPILLAPAKLAGLVARLLGRKAVDCTQALARELDALAFLEQPARPARLEVATALSVPVEGEGLSGELGLPLEVAPEPVARIGVLLSGRPLGERQLELLGLPLRGVVSGEAFRPDADHREVVADAAWRAAEQALRSAAERLVPAAVEALHGGGFGAQAARAARQALRAGLRKSFEGRADALGAEAQPDWRRALAEARVFEAVSGEVLSALDLTRALARDGFLWVVDASSGRPARGRLMLAAAQGAREALEAVFGAGALRDGSERLALDERAERRRLTAPRVEELPPLSLLESVELQAEAPLGVRGVVGLRLGAPEGQAGIVARLLVEGRLLGEHTFAHPLPGLAQLDLEGLRVDEGWQAPAEPAQLEGLADLLAGALWEATRRLAERVAATGRASAEERRCVQRALAHHDAGRSGGQDGEQVRAIERALLAAPVFEALDGAPLGGAEVVAEARAGRLAVLSAETRAACPAVPVRAFGPWGCVVVAEREELALLRRLVGPRLILADRAWRERARFEDPGLLTLVRTGLERAAQQALRGALLAAFRAALDAMELEEGHGRRLVRLEEQRPRLDPAHPLWRAVQARLQAGASPDALPHLLVAVLAGLTPAILGGEQAQELLAALAGRSPAGPGDGDGG